MRCIGITDPMQWTGAFFKILLFRPGLENCDAMHANLFSVRGVATAAWIIAWWIKTLPPYERDFTVDDVIINHVHRKNQYVLFHVS